MQLQTRSMCATLLAAHQLKLFTDWLRVDSHRVVDAAELLGGEGWKTRAETMIDAIGNGSPPDALVAELRSLHKLLSLDHVDDLDSEEAARFFGIDPDDPRADGARLCCEAFAQGLEAMAIVGAAGHSDGEIA